MAAVDEVAAALRSALGDLHGRSTAQICVALSGGLDSSVLLHATAALWPGRVRALYVNHQLQAQASDWGRHCADLCARLGVPYEALTVSVPAGSGEGPEAAARRVRYQALAAALGAGEVLLTAHHLDDQCETLLLNLMRGAGPAGLAGIPARAPLGPGEVRRPLLELPRRALREYAGRTGLTWIEDPANEDQRLDRNYLRRTVLPALEQRWPGVRATVGRSARLAGEAAQLLEELAAQDARRVLRAGRIVMPALARLSDARRRNAVRHLCRVRLGCVPPEARLREGLAQLLAAGEGRHPLLAWPGGEIRRYRGALYLLRPAAPVAPDLCLELPARAGARLDLGEGRGVLRLVRARGRGLAGARLPDTLQVRFRAGGERFQPAGSVHGRELKKLLQDHGVVPWMRGRIPLLFSGGELVAVAGIWVAEAAAAHDREPGLRVRWDEHPPIV